MTIASGEFHNGAEQPPSLAAIHLEHALGFYNDMLDIYGKSVRQNRIGFKAEEAARNWEEANVLLCDYAIDVADPNLATRCYTYIQNPARQWEQVAKAYHAGHYIMAVEWQTPLLYAIEQGEYTTVDLLAMHKTTASIAYDRIPYVDDPREKDTLRNEIVTSWLSARTLMQAQTGEDMVPFRTPGKQNNGIPAEQDVRFHYADFAKLCADNGDFELATEIMAGANKITHDVENYDFSHSRDAQNRYNDFTPTFELRQLTYGLSEAEVRKQAKHWQHNAKQLTTRTIAAGIAGARINESDPEILAASLYVEKAYPALRLNHLNAVLKPNTATLRE